MAFNTISKHQPQVCPKFILYDGPPTQKRPPQRPSKIPSKDEGLKVTTNAVEPSAKTRLEDNEGYREIGGSDGKSGDNSNNDSPQGDLVRISAKDPSLSLPELSEICSQGATAVISLSGSETDAGDLCEEDADLHESDWLEPFSPSITERCDLGTIDAINLDGAEPQAAESRHYQLLSTPPTSPSILNIVQPTQELLNDKKAGSEAALPITGSVSSGSSGDDTDDDTNDVKQALLPTRKRVRFARATSASCKRQNRGPTHSKCNTKQRRPPPSQELTNPYLLPDLGTASEVQLSDAEMRYEEDSSDECGDESDGSGRHLRNQLGPIAGRPGNLSRSPSRVVEHSSTHAPPQADGTTRRTAKSIPAEETYRHLSNVTFHPLKADIFFLTAFFSTCSGRGILTCSRAVGILEKFVGPAGKLDGITVRPVTTDTWFLTSFVKYASDIATLESGQRASDLSNSQLNRADTAPAQRCGRPSDDIDDESSSDDYGDEYHERQSDNVDETSSYRKSRWSLEEDKCLRESKEAGQNWEQIFRQFPERTPGAVRTRWHTKFREKA